MRTALRRSRRLPDGSRERGRGDPGDPRRHRAGGGRRDGETRAPLPGRDPPREGRDGLPDGRVSGLGRVRDDQGRDTERVAGRTAHRARGPDVDPTRGRRPHPHVPREGGGGLADVVSAAIQVTFDAADPVGLAGFWKTVLGYIEEPPPEGWSTWEDWARE